MVRAPTQADVAARAGVSRALVSMALAGRPEVADQTRATIRRTADELGYRVNAAAASLARRRTHTVGIVLQDIANPYFSEIGVHLQEAMLGVGLTSLIHDCHRSAERERAAIEVFWQMRVDALVVVSPLQRAADLAAVGAQIPTVAVGSSPLPGVDIVHVDSRAGARAATKHLIGLGHTEIVYLDAPAGVREQPVARRRAGYRAAMRAAGLTAIVVPGRGPDPESGQDPVGRMVAEDRLPTALLAHNDATAVAALATLAREGVAVPERVSVMGYDNTALAALPQLDLSTVDQVSAQVGQTAAELIVERAEGRREPRVVVLTPRLVVRGTTGPAHRRA